MTEERVEEVEKVEKIEKKIAVHGIRYSRSDLPGQFRAGVGQLGWRSDRNSEVVGVRCSSVKRCVVSKISQKTYSLSLTLDDPSRPESYRFSGFDSQTIETLKQFLKDYMTSSVVVEEEEISLESLSWAKLSFQNSCLRLESGGKLLSDLPLDLISHSSVDKNILRLNLENTLSSQQSEALCEIKFQTHGTQELKKSKKGAPGFEEELQKAMEEDEKQIIDLHKTLTEFHPKLQEQPVADSNLICSFGELSLVVPRGRHELVLYKNRLLVKGKTFSHSLNCNDLEKIFFLPVAPAYDQVLFVLSLSQPIHVGRTSHEHVVAQIASSTEIENMPVSLSKEILKTNEIEFEEEGKESICRGSLLTLLKSILPLLAKNLKVIHPSSRFQQSQDRAKVILCHYGIETGYIYVCDDYLVFAPKPMVVLKFNSIQMIDFCGGYVGAETNSRFFELHLHTKMKKIYEFKNLAKVDRVPLIKFFESSSIVLRNADLPKQMEMKEAENQDEDSDTASELDSHELEESSYESNFD